MERGKTKSCPHYSQPYKVVGIKDGDTVVLLNLKDSTKTTVRLNSVDSPEKDQPYGMKAKQFTSDFCYGKTVDLVSSGKDRYKRTLGDIVYNGESLNRNLVKNGYAWHHKQYSKDRVLDSLENLAKVNKAGLWIEGNCVAPWEWRKR